MDNFFKKSDQSFVACFNTFDKTLTKRQIVCYCVSRVFIPDFSKEKFLLLQHLNNSFFVFVCELKILKQPQE